MDRLILSVSLLLVSTLMGGVARADVTPWSLPTTPQAQGSNNDSCIRNLIESIFDDGGIRLWSGDQLVGYTEYDGLMGADTLDDDEMARAESSITAIRSGESGYAFRAEVIYHRNHMNLDMGAPHFQRIAVSGWIRPGEFISTHRGPVRCSVNFDSESEHTQTNFIVRRTHSGEELARIGEGFPAQYIDRFDYTPPRGRPSSSSRHRSWSGDRGL